jgi:hypothetical protein
MILCLAKFWENNDDGKREAIQEKAHVQLCGLLTDPSTEVRAATVYALGNFINRVPHASSSSSPSSSPSEQRSIIDLNLGLTLAIAVSDASHLVRKEFVVALSALIAAYEEKFKQVEMKWIKSQITKAPSLTGFSLLPPPSPSLFVFSFSYFPHLFLLVSPVSFFDRLFLFFPLPLNRIFEPSK